MEMKRLRELRTERQLSLQKLGDAIGGISPQRLQQYEKGTYEPDISVLKELAEFFGVTIDYLVDRTDLRYAPPFDQREIQVLTKMHDWDDQCKDALCLLLDRLQPGTRSESTKEEKSAPRQE